MLRILLVDDQPIEIETIRILIQRYELPLAVYDARNGEEALHFMKNNPIDILFTDIRMPFMDGIELSRQAQQLNDSLLIIMYTAYSEFEYAKQAIQLRVFDYILKPIHIDQFLDVMHKVISHCTQSHQNRIRQHYLASLERGVQLRHLLHTNQFAAHPDSEEAWFNWNTGIRIVLIEANKPFFHQHYFAFQEELKIVMQASYDAVLLNDTQVVIFIQSCTEMEAENETYWRCFGDAIQHCCKRLDSIKSSVIVSRLLYAHHEASEAFSTMEQLLAYQFFYEDGVTWLFEDNNEYSANSTLDLDQLAQQIHVLAEQKRYQEIKHHFETLLDHFRGNKRFSPMHVKVMITNLFESVPALLSTSHKQHLLTRITHIMESKNLFDIQEILSSMFDELEMNKPEDSNRKVIDEVIQIVKTNYGSELSVEYLAQRVFLSPSYLSVLYKKETGQSLNKFITEFRMETAKSLLSQTNMKIVDISERVGYANPSYFTLLFKTSFGVTPAQFRDRS